MDMKTVSCALPSELVDTIDRYIEGTFTSRAHWMRIAILKSAHDEGLVKLTLDNKGQRLRARPFGGRRVTNYPPPRGATYVPGMRAGQWKARKAVAEKRQARKEADAEGDRARNQMIARSFWGEALGNAKVRREGAQAQVEKATRRLAGLERQALEDPRKFPEVTQARTELEVVKDLLDRLRATEAAERAKLEARIAAAEAQDAIEAAERDRMAARTAAADAERAELEARIAAAEARDATK